MSNFFCPLYRKRKSRKLIINKITDDVVECSSNRMDVDSIPSRNNVDNNIVNTSNTNSSQHSNNQISNHQKTVEMLSSPEFVEENKFDISTSEYVSLPVGMLLINIIISYLFIHYLLCYKYLNYNLYSKTK